MGRCLGAPGWPRVEFEKGSVCNAADGVYGLKYSKPNS